MAWWFWPPPEGQVLPPRIGRVVRLFDFSNFLTKAYFLKLEEKLITRRDLPRALVEPPNCFTSIFLEKHTWSKQSM